MTMNICPECGKDVSAKAIICIGCGYPFDKFHFKMAKCVFDIIEDAIGDYCMRCPEDTINDDTICERCHIRKFMDKMCEIKD